MAVSEFPKGVKYPILEAIIANGDEEITHDMCGLLGITRKAFTRKRMGSLPWNLEECIILRDVYAPALSVEDMFCVLPALEKEPQPVTEEEMKGGFNPAFYE